MKKYLSSLPVFIRRRKTEYDLPTFPKCEVDPIGLFKTFLGRKTFHRDVQVLKEIYREVNLLSVTERKKTNHDTLSIRMPLTGGILKCFKKG